MREELSRSVLLVGEEAIEKLKRAKIAVFGLGGVGGYVCEALARAGIGSMLLVDNDTVNLSNINRQIIALHSTVGQKKTEVMKKRILDINPDIDVQVRDEFFLPENSSSFVFKDFDYIVDAIDTVTAKIELIMKAKEYSVPVISAMGAGNKLDAGAFEVTDIYSTHDCPLAKVMRRELKKRGVESLKVVYSTATAIKPDTDERGVVGSMSYVPGVSGLILAGEVIKDIIGA